jgi:hypothetical protein
MSLAQDLHLTSITIMKNQHERYFMINKELAMQSQCPLYPRKRTIVGAIGMSVKTKGRQLFNLVIRALGINALGTLDSNCRLPPAKP